MSRSNGMSVLLAAALLALPALPARADMESYNGISGIETCPAIPHYPNADGDLPALHGIKDRLAFVRIKDDGSTVVDWFKAHLPPGWTYDQPAPDVWPQTPIFNGPGGQSIQVLINDYPKSIRYLC